MHVYNFFILLNAFIWCAFSYKNFDMQTEIKSIIPQKRTRNIGVVFGVILTTILARNMLINDTQSSEIGRSLNETGSINSKLSMCRQKRPTGAQFPPFPYLTPFSSPAIVDQQVPDIRPCPYRPLADDRTTGARIIIFTLRPSAVDRILDDRFANVPVPTVLRWSPDERPIKRC